MTQEEWDKRWMGVYDQMWMQTRNHQRSLDYAHRWMLANHGPRPEGVPGPPWWLNLAALSFGANMQKIWDWFNGRKTIIGAVITILSTLAGVLPVVLAAVGASAVLTAKVVGIATMVVGVAHKIYKFIYKEDHP